MTVRVDSNDPTPPYEQIRSQLERHIESGLLPVGDRLPTVRQLAGDLRVAPGTVARAYKELELAGLVDTRRAAGTRVAKRPVMTPAERRARVTDALTHAVVTARTMGCSDDEIANAWSAAFRRG